MTQEQKQAIFFDYSDRSITLRELEKKYSKPRKEITRIAIEQGAAPRRPSTFGRSRNAEKQAIICSKCKKAVDVQGARFCCFCGEDIRTEKQKLCERLEKAIKLVGFLPANNRDEMRDVLLDAITALKS